MQASLGGQSHAALPVAGADATRSAGSTFLRADVAADCPPVAVVCPSTAELLHPVVADVPVVWVDWSEIFEAGPPAAITSLRRLAARLRPTRDAVVQLLIEPLAGPDPDSWREWQRFEAVLDHVTANEPVVLGCLHDEQRQPAPVLETVRCTHAVLLRGAAVEINPAHRDPADVLAGLPVPAEPLESTEPLVAARAVRDLRGLRRELAAGAAAAGLDTAHPRFEDFLLAVDEMTTNALRHGRPPVDLRLWADPERLVCRVTDRGRGLDDPFFGYGPAHGEDLSQGGMGLWLARQLCDHVDILTDGDGVSIRLTTSLV